MTLHTTVPRHHCSSFLKFEGCGLNREEKRELHSYAENAGSLPGKSTAQIKEELKDGEKKGTFGEKKGTLGWPRLAGHMQTNKPEPSVLLLPAKVTPLLPQNLLRHTCPAPVPVGGCVPLWQQPCFNGKSWAPAQSPGAPSVALDPPQHQGHSRPLAAEHRMGQDSVFLGKSCRQEGSLLRQGCGSRTQAGHGGRLRCWGLAHCCCFTSSTERAENRGPGLQSPPLECFTLSCALFQHCLSLCPFPALLTHRFVAGQHRQPCSHPLQPTEH